MKIGVIGLGHVGLVTAACLARIGHEVHGLDSDAERIEELHRGRTPFYEPGLDDLIAEGRVSGRLRFTTDPAGGVTEAEIVFICVGTPSRANGEADLSQVEDLIWTIARHLQSYVVLVEKSTVPVTTNGRIAKTLRRLGVEEFDVASNPEFLREGSAIEDTLKPDRIVIGSPSDRATDILRRVYEPILRESEASFLVTDVGTAEVIKHASNAFLATKISFINSVAEICEASGANVKTVAEGMGLDRRIERAFLDAGLGFGGSCFPKDVAAFAALAERLDCETSLLRAVQKINQRSRVKIIEKLRGELWHLRAKRIAVLGLSFKPGTDDMRDAPSVTIVESLVEEGADVVVYDPVSMPRAKDVLPPSIGYAGSALEAVQGADAAVFVTEWDEFRDIEPGVLKSALRLPVVIDGRNLFNLHEMEEAELTYISVGRPAVRSAGS